MSFRSMLKTGKKTASYSDIKREVLTEDEYGGYTTTWVIKHRRVLCRFNALSATTQALLWSKQATLADYYIYLEYLSDIKEGDRLIKMDDSREFEVKLKMDWDEDRSMLKLACLEVGRNE